MERADFEQWKSKEVARLLALVETERRYYQEMVASLPIALVVLRQLLVRFSPVLRIVVMLVAAIALCLHAGWAPKLDWRGS